VVLIWFLSGFFLSCCCNWSNSRFPFGFMLNLTKSLFICEIQFLFEFWTKPPTQLFFSQKIKILFLFSIFRMFKFYKELILIMNQILIFSPFSLENNYISNVKPMNWYFDKHFHFYHFLILFPS
jgi:hypothetical protein